MEMILLVLRNVVRDWRFVLHCLRHFDDSLVRESGWRIRVLLRRRNGGNGDDDDGDDDGGGDDGDDVHRRWQSSPLE